MKNMKQSRIITRVRLAFLAISLFGAVMTSCTFEQEDYFDESASLRITHTNEQIKDRLVTQSSEGNYGWVIQYFVAGTDNYDFEGFNLFGRFYADNKVTLASNHRYLRNGNANKYTEYSSNYEMLAEEGPVLSFNTWNDILTVFEDPVDPQSAPGSLVSNGEGMNGDHNLVLSSYDDACITFHGERHGARIRFIPCDRPWEEYIAATAKTKSDIATSTITSYYVTNGTDTMYFAGLNKGYFSYCDRVNDPLVSSTLSCVFTPTGFRLHRENNLNGVKFQEFHMAADSTCLLSEDDSVRVVALWDNYIVNVRNATWNFDLEQLTSAQKSLVEQIAAEFTKYSKNYTLASIGLGRSTGKNAVKGLVFTYYTNTAKTKTNTAGLALSTSRPAFGQMQIGYEENCSVDGNMEALAKKTDIESLVRQLGASFVGVYDITPNNYFLPTGCTLQASNGTKYILK